MKQREREGYIYTYTQQAAENIYTQKIYIYADLIHTKRKIDTQKYIYIYIPTTRCLKYIHTRS
jgi:hypothetical protein